jgi:hypothetical protein
MTPQLPAYGRVILTVWLHASTERNEARAKSVMSYLSE